jgi:Tol biopolymer transport system component
MRHRRWWRRARWLALGGLLGCGRIEFSRLDDTSPVACDPAAPFDPPRLLGLGPEGAPADPALSADERVLYFTRDSPDGDRDLFVVARHSLESRFGVPIGLGALNSSGDDAVASISADGLTLLFHSRRVAGEGSHLYVATRTSPFAELGAPALVAGVASPDVTADDLQAFLAGDGDELWFVSDRDGSQDIYRAERAGGGFANPELVPELSSLDTEQHVMLSADRLTAYFASTRDVPGARGSFDIHRANRASIEDPFELPAPVPELNTPSSDNPRWLSPDQCRLYLHSNRSGAFQIYVATRHPE